MPAQTTQGAGKLGLALYFSEAPGNGWNGSLFVLYDAKALISAIDAEVVKAEKTEKIDFMKDLSDAERQSAINEILMDELRGQIYAIINLRDDARGNAYDTKMVGSSAARKGYGPLIYDIAMAQAGGIMPDRRSVSDDAHRVWDYYQKNRGDVEAKQIDDMWDPKTPTEVDDALMAKGEPEDSSLNQAYFIKNFPQVSNLQANHQALLDTYAVSDVDPGFAMAADQFFLEKY